MRYRVLRRVFLVLAAVLFRLRVQGAERIPTTGAVVLVAAHRSWLDPACVAAATARPVRFLILDAVNRRRWVRWLSRAAGAIPVDPGPTALRGTREALRRLRRGELIGVFPEGRVFSDARPGELRRGAALLAVHGGARIVPLHILGSATAWPHGGWPRPARVRVVVGEPIAAASGSSAEQSIAETMRRISDSLVDLRRRVTPANAGEAR